MLKVIQILDLFKINVPQEFRQNHSNPKFCYNYFFQDNQKKVFFIKSSAVRQLDRSITFEINNKKNMAQMIRDNVPSLTRQRMKTFSDELIETMKNEESFRVAVIEGEVKFSKSRPDKPMRRKFITSDRRPLLGKEFVVEKLNNITGEITIREI